MKQFEFNIARQNTGMEPWPGGMMLITVDGQFANDGNVRTAVTITSKTVRPDGTSDGKFHRVASIFEPGSHAVAVGPGLFQINASGPDKLPWSVTVTVDE
jgi:hypothetical protein